MKSSLRKNFVYNFLYQLLLMAIPLVTTPYLSRVLGSNGIGRYSYAYAVAYYFVLFGMLGVNNYGNRTIAMSRHDKKLLSTNFWSIYWCQLFFSIITLFAYIPYLIFIADDKLIALIMLPYVFSALLDINWFFFGIENFKLTVTRNAAIKLLTLIGIFLFVKSKDDLAVYAIINVVGIVLSQLLLWSFLKKYIDYQRVSLNEIKIHIKPNLTLFVPVIAISLYKLMDKVMLASMTDYYQVGYFETSEKIIQIPLAIVTSIGTVMLPKMSNLVSEGLHNQSKNYIKNSVQFTILIISAMAFGIMAVSKEFVPLFYGKGYEMNIVLFQILLPSCIFIAVANVVRTQYLIPYKKDDIYIKSTIIGAVVNIVINIILIPKFASIGAAIGTLCAEAVVCIYQVYCIKNEINILQYLKNSMSFILLGFLMYVVLYNLHIPDNSFISLVYKIILGILTYSTLGIFYILQKRKKQYNGKSS